VTRLDRDTGAVLGRIAVPPGSGCSVGGAFPAEVWSTCSKFQRAVGPDGVVVSRIDTGTGSVAAVATLPTLGGGYFVANGIPWFSVPHDSANGTVTTDLVALDPASGRAVAAPDVGPLDADYLVVTSTVVWIPDEQGHRVLEFSLASLRP
jgi:hypothetical protein